MHPLAATPIGFFPKITRLGASVVSDAQVDEICSVSECISPGPPGWIEHWVHNEWGLFDTEGLARRIIPNEGTGYDLYAYELAPYRCDGDFLEPLPVQSQADGIPEDYELLGYDIVSRSDGAFFEHSPLSCNDGAQRFAANRYCLIEDGKAALQAMQAISRDGTYEPGPYYLVRVYRRRSDLFHASR